MKKSTLYIITVSLMFLVNTANAQIYKCKNSQGKIDFTDKPCPTTTKSSYESVSKIVPNEKAKERKDIKSKEHSNLHKSIKLTIRNLFEQRQFRDVGRKLNDYQLIVEKDITKEKDLFNAYEAFNINKNYTELLNQWVAEDPDSYSAYAARAYHNYWNAWQARGAKWSSETDNKQIDRMHYYFTKVKADIKKVKELNTKTIIPYYLEIGMLKSYSNKPSQTDTPLVLRRAETKGYNAIGDSLHRGLQISPYSYKLRNKYFQSLTPRWGGTYFIMEEEAKKIIPLIKNNPRLALLQGLAYADKADIATRKSAYNQADELFHKALTYGDNDIVFRNRGKNFYYQDRYKEALEQFDNAIDSNHEDGEHYYWRAKTHSYLKMYQASLNDLKRANELKPNDEAIQSYFQTLATQFYAQGATLSEQAFYPMSLKQFDQSLELWPDYGHSLYGKAYVLHRMQRDDEALIEIKKAIDAEPTVFRHYKLLDNILVRSRDWNQIIRHWDKFIELSPHNVEAFLERSGSNYHSGNLIAATRDAKIAMDMGSSAGREWYYKLIDLQK